MTRAYVDAFTVEVVRNALNSIAEEMSVVVMRSARSPLLREAGDLSSALTDATGELIAQGRDIPVHVGVMAATVKEFLKRVPPARLAPGDGWFLNLPAAGGNLGIPALDLEPLSSGGIYVMEMSSYQLEITVSITFDVGVLLNISADHIERHGGLDGYVAAKRMIFHRQTSPRSTPTTWRTPSKTNGQLHTSSVRRHVGVDRSGSPWGSSPQAGGGVVARHQGWKTGHRHDRSRVGRNADTPRTPRQSAGRPRIHPTAARPATSPRVEQL